MKFSLDFIGIGSGKCGSTWLYRNLVKHPAICNANLKELNYFSDLYETHPFDWYEGQFKGCAPGLARGEFSVTYLTHPEAPMRIRRHFPEVRLLAILRDPVKRAYSNYLHSIRKGDIPARLAFSEYVQNDRFLSPGRYAQHLKRYFDLFQPTQIRVILAEEFTADPLSGYRSLYAFLGVSNPDFVPPDYDRRHNEARSYRSLWLENLLVRSYRRLSRGGHTKFVKWMTESGIPELLRRLNSDGRPVSSVDDSSGLWLRDYYRAANEDLESLLKRKLPASWYASDGANNR